METLGITREEATPKPRIQFLPKGYQALGAIVGLNDKFAPGAEVFKGKGRSKLKIRLSFRCLGGEADGHYINDEVWIAADEDGFHGSDGSRKHLGRILVALGIDSENWLVPRTPEEAIAAVTGQDVTVLNDDGTEGVKSWKDQSWLNRPVIMVCDAPNQYTNKNGEEKGPFSKFGFWNEATDAQINEAIMMLAELSSKKDNDEMDFPPADEAEAEADDFIFED
jgi:hypothetical protein